MLEIIVKNNKYLNIFSSLKAYTKDSRSISTTNQIFILLTLLFKTKKLLSVNVRSQIGLTLQQMEQASEVVKKWKPEMDTTG